MQQELQKFIDQHVATLKDVIKERYLLHWEYDTTGNESLLEKKEQVDKKYLKLYSDRDKFAKIKAYKESGKIKDPILQRQMNLLFNSFQLHQIDPQQVTKMVELETKIQSIYNHYRGKLDGESLNDNQLKQILQNETDNKRLQSAWESSKQLGAEVEKLVLELVRLRNKNAQQAGYRDYYAMSLACQDLSEEKLFATLDRLKELTDKPFKEMKQKLDASLAERFSVEVDQLRPWHYGDPFFQSLPAYFGELNLDHFFSKSDIEHLTRETFSGIGMHIDDILKNSDLYPKEGKCQHAFCSMLDRETRDIRILCNIDNTEQWTSTMLHEFGHAVYDKYIGNDLPYLLQNTAHTLSTEAIAIMMEALTKDEKWLVQVAGASEEDVEKVKDNLREALRVTKLIFVRWGLVMTYFERELYHNPEQDLNSLWWKLVKEFQGITVPEDRNAPDWGAKLHLALAPVYYHNYIYGQMIAYQLLDYIQNNVGNGQLFANPELGPYLIGKYFDSGSKYDWNTTLKNATGENLNPERFAKFLDN